MAYIDYKLDDGEMRHNANPVGFYIPPIEERNNLAIDDLAKLIFVYNDGNAERMWVRILSILTDIHGAKHYVGSLCNRPVCCFNDELSFGSIVSFEPKHIIDFDWW
jgi:hypothetical protein